jgi:uncharacterized metal-binding protein
MVGPPERGWIADDQSERTKCAAARTVRIDSEPTIIRKRAMTTRKDRKRQPKPRCDRCKHFDCVEGKDCHEIRATIQPRYEDDTVVARIARAAARVESEHYGAATRLEEVVHFARHAGFKHLGVAFCVGFKEEARIVCEMLRVHFTVSSVCCKCGGISKNDLGYPLVRGGPDESICSPLGQAALLNGAGTDLNVIMGLCVGHDALFTMESKAPVTTLVAKDRVLAHNPVGAITCPYVNRRLREGLFAKPDESATET